MWFPCLEKKIKLSIYKDERKQLNFVKEEVSHEIMLSAFFQKAAGDSVGINSVTSVSLLDSIPFIRELQAFLDNFKAWQYLWENIQQKIKSFWQIARIDKITSRNVHWSDSS